MCSKTRSSPMRFLKGHMMKRMHGMITCREFEDFVLSYLDGELTPRQTRVFKMHMYLCRECREYLNAYQTSIELSKALRHEPGKPTAEEVPEDLIKAILAAKNA
jgi:predicted anti-sigma-YlaC factor YlaD